MMWTSSHPRVILLLLLSLSLSVLQTEAIKCQLCPGGGGGGCLGTDEAIEHDCPYSTYCSLNVTNAGTHYQGCGKIEKGDVAGMLGAGQEFFPRTVRQVGQVESRDWEVCCQRCQVDHPDTALYGFNGRKETCRCLERIPGKRPRTAARPRVHFGQKLEDNTKTGGSSERGVRKEEHYAGLCGSRIWEDDVELKWEGNLKCKSSATGKVCYCHGDNCNPASQTSNSAFFMGINLLVVMSKII